MKFCVKCGKKTEKLKEALCSSCSDSHYSLSIKELSTKVCLRCRKYLFQNKWLKAHNLDEIIKYIAKSSIKEKISVKTDIPEHYTKPGIEFDAAAIIKIRNNDYSVPIKILFTSCDRCSKENTKYFEGNLQLRTTDKEIIMFAEKLLKDAREKGIFVSKREEVKNGIDYYITSKSFIRKLAKELKKRFKGEITETATLFTRNKQTSRDVYRNTFLYKSEELL